MSSFTYIVVIVFHDAVALRALFHGLVRATQIALLGFNRYAAFYVCGFVRTRVDHHSLKAQAFQLDTRLRSLPGRFSLSRTK